MAMHLRSVGKRFTLLLLGIFFIQNLVAQVPAELRQRLIGKAKLQEIMQEVTGYYEQQREAGTAGSETETLHENEPYRWARWAQELSNRLDQQGRPVNYAARNMAVVQQRSTPGSVELAYGNWNPLGPDSVFYGAVSGRGLARVDRIAFDPVNAQILYAGTPAGGLYKTTDGGINWTSMSGYIPSLGISGIVVSFADPNTIYVLTGDGDSYLSRWAENVNSIGFIEEYGYLRMSKGVWKSTDGGITWSATGQLAPPDTYAGLKLVQDPSNANVLLAATTAGLYRTSNAGVSWTRVIAGLVGDVAFQPGAANTRAYATGEGWMKYSTNEGQTWPSSGVFNIALPDTSKLVIGVTPLNSSVVYLYSGYSTNGNFGGIYKSVNAGSNFTRQSFSPNINGDQTDGSGKASNGAYSMGLAVSTTNSTHINTGCTITWRSTNSGSTMVNTTDYFERDTCSGTPCPQLNRYIHPDVHCMEYNPLNNYLYAGCDGGVWRSTDEGLNWTDFSTGIDAAQVYHFSALPNNSNNLLCGMQDNGLNYRSGVTSNFRHLASGDGFGVVLDPSNAGSGYATVNTFVYRISNNFNTVSNISPLANPNTWFGNVMLNPSNSNMVFVGYRYLWKSAAQGAPGSWQRIDSASGNWAMTACPSNLARYYAAGARSTWSDTGEIYRSNDTGRTWTSITRVASFPAYGTHPKITSLTVNPVNSSQLWCSFGGYSAATKVYYTSNGGTTWVNKTGSLPNVPVNSIAADNAGNIYAGTDVGVYFRGASMADWVPFYNRLPNVPVTDLIINTTAGDINASTFGRGIWKSSLYAACDASLLVSWSINSSRYYEAGNDLTGNSLISGSADGATQVVFRSGNYLRFTPGFEVKAGNEFKATIGACASGIPVFRAQQLDTIAQRRSAVAVTLNNTEASKSAIIRGFQQRIDQLHVRFEVTAPGSVQFMLTDMQLQGVFQTGMAQAETGIFDEQLPVGGLLPGTYYLILLHNEKAVHYQEIEITRF